MRTSSVDSRFPSADSVEPEATADFESARARLFGIAYQRLGRAADAEDVVQSVWVRWQGVDRAQIRNRAAFLSTVTTRVALNVATSAYARREISTGEWLPDLPLDSADPALEAERGQALRAAVQLLMERLSPAERAVCVLREAFGYPFGEIGKLLGLADSSARQLAVRARRHLTERRRNAVDPAERAELLEAFRTAAAGGGMACLIDLLAGGLTATRESGHETAERPAGGRTRSGRRPATRAPRAGRSGRHAA